MINSPKSIREANNTKDRNKLPHALIDATRTLTGARQHILSTDLLLGLRIVSLEKYYHRSLEANLQQADHVDCCEIDRIHQLYRLDFSSWLNSDLSSPADAGLNLGLLGLSAANSQP